METAVAVAPATEATQSFDQESIVQVQPTLEGAPFPYLIICVSSTWMTLRGQELKITFNLQTEIANAKFPSKSEDAVFWVNGEPTGATVTTVDDTTLEVIQTNYNTGPGDQTFAFHVGVEIDGVNYYSFDPTIINSPTGG